MEPHDAAVVILAAGRSERMKELKAFLPFNHHVRFIEQIHSAYSGWGCSEIIVVISPEALQWMNQTKMNLPGVTLVVNDQPEHERFYSVKLGIKAVGNASYCFIHNVDNPFIDTQILDMLYTQRSNDQYISPVFEHKGGHPVLLNRKNMAFILHYPDKSANMKVVLNEMDCKKVEMQNDTTLININSPEQYLRFFQK